MGNNTMAQNRDLNLSDIVDVFMGETSTQPSRQVLGFSAANIILGAQNARTTWHVSVTLCDYNRNPCAAVEEIHCGFDQRRAGQDYRTSLIHLLERMRAQEAASPVSTRPPYRGYRRKLVLAFDVGTTYSGISYAVLDPGQVPEIKPVTRFPAHEHISGASKIPTVIYYDRTGHVKLGQDRMVQTAPPSLAPLHRPNHLRIPPLPTRKTIVHVLGDFLRYLKYCAELYIKDTHANGPELWSSVEGDVDYVLSHPNGWEGVQQEKMRKAAVLGGLVPDTAVGMKRISFVSEGEASLHFSISNGLPSGVMSRGEGVVVVDAGGGTVDISAYGRQVGSTRDTVFEEIAPPQCHFHGSVFVTIHAGVFLGDYLKDSPFLDDLEHILRCFDKTTKPRFRSAGEPQYVKFGSTRDNDPQVNVRFGQMKLEGKDVAGWFEPSVRCVVEGVCEMRRVAHRQMTHVVLVGGFAASDWLFERVKEGLKVHGMNVVRPENHVNKAVSDGAISFYLDHFVNTRISKITYGNFCHITFDPNDEEHRKRERGVFTSISGLKRIADSFDIILPKNQQVSETKEFRKGYFRESDKRGDFRVSRFVVWGYKGAHIAPRWRDVDRENYVQICSIEVDLSRLTLQPRRNERGVVFYRLDYEIVLLFGLTEFKAQVAYREDVRTLLLLRTSARLQADPDFGVDRALRRGVKPRFYTTKLKSFLRGASLEGRSGQSQIISDVLLIVVRRFPEESYIFTGTRRSSAEGAGGSGFHAISIWRCQVKQRKERSGNVVQTFKRCRLSIHTSRAHDHLSEVQWIQGMGRRSMASARPAYDGPRRKLIIAFDVGTTYSGVSYTILTPGEVPEIRGVTRFPAQEHVGGDCKIPSLMFYDKEGKVRAIGAEAIREEAVAMKEDEEWVATPWFKLHLRPKEGMTAIPADPASKIPPLPPNKTAVQVLADFMRYLYKCTRNYIEETHIGFSSAPDSTTTEKKDGLFDTLEKEGQIHFVLSHPNGWEGAQQEKMRRAAVLAGLVPPDDEEAAASRISFVTEGEASLHFCLRSGLGVESVVKEGKGVLIVDAGGGTVDMSAYAKAGKEEWFEEVEKAQCHFVGSIFVTFAARAFLEGEGPRALT
ncbi:hypothetical protein NMY22_g10627 [Coprinellus aureogranulatus]|nr:hypothetical protein NMY22_g10627 [Coprinellus aureogranulatus]